MPLWLVGNKGIITEIVIAPSEKKESVSYHFLGDWEPMTTGMIPVGMHYYGKVITGNDRNLEIG